MCGKTYFLLYLTFGVTDRDVQNSMTGGGHNNLTEHICMEKILFYEVTLKLGGTCSGFDTYNRAGLKLHPSCPDDFPGYGYMACRIHSRAKFLHVTALLQRVLIY